MISTLFKIKGVIDNSLRGCATAADVFAGITITKNVIPSQKLPEPTHGGRHTVTMLPGVASGPLLMKYVREIFDTAYVPVDFEIIETDEKNHSAIDDDCAVFSLRRNGVGIKGHIPSFADISGNLTLRQHLDLFVYLVHIKSYSTIKCKYPNLDIYLFRQNTEGEYAMLEHETKPGIVESLKIITRSNTERFARWALEFAKREGRKKVTVVHKANIMKLSDGLFLRTVYDVAKKEYPELKMDNMIVDNCCMQMVAYPEAFDVLVMPNLYGNILTNVLCGLIGGPGLISGQNYSESTAVFEAASRHTLYEDDEVVNPVAMLNAAVNMLYHIKRNNHAELIRKALDKTILEDKIHTSDIGGSHSSDEMVETIKKNIQESVKTKFPSL